MDDLLSEFLTEANESISMLDVELVNLEQNPNDPALLGNIFRLVHTIKGTCGFLGLSRLESVAHAAENVLGKVRDGELIVSPMAVSLILESLDCIKMIMGELEANEAEPAGDDSDVIGRLNQLANGDAVASESTVPVSASLVAEPTEATEQPPGERFTHDTPTERESEPTGSVEGQAEVAASAARSADATKESAVAGQSIRVNVDLLENLMTMVSELVLTRNQLMQILRSQKDSEFTT